MTEDQSLKIRRYKSFERKRYINIIVQFDDKCKVGNFFTHDDGKIAYFPNHVSENPEVARY